MNVCFVHPGYDKYEWAARACAALGHSVRTVSTLDGVVQADRDSDVIVFAQRAAGLNMVDLAQAALNRRCLWTTWAFDLLVSVPGRRIVDQPQIKRGPMLGVLQAMDIVFVKERESLGLYHADDINAVWLDQGCPWWLEACEHPAQPEWDVLMLGKLDHEYSQRAQDVGALISAGLKVAWAAAPCGLPHNVVQLPFTPPAKLPALASRAAMTLGVDIRHDTDGYWSDRLWLACGMGSCHLRRLSPGLPIGPYPTYRTAQELVEQACFYRDHPDDRRDVGQRAREWAIAEHSYETRIKTLLMEVERCKTQRGGSAVERADAVSA